MHSAAPITLSIIIPCYNEEKFIGGVLSAVAAQRDQVGGVGFEVIVVDDGSTDGTWETIQKLTGPRLRAYRHEENRGKGAALRTAIPHAQGDYVVVQDVDMEYDPADLVTMLQVAESRNAPVVYGNRVHGRFRMSYFRFYGGGRLLTLVTNLLFRTGIHDEPVCYKMCRRELLQSLPLRCDGFEFCPEVTALVRRRGVRIHEVPITYHGRTYAEGKKIRWTDAVEAVWTLVKGRFRSCPQRAISFQPSALIFALRADVFLVFKS